MGDFTDFRQLRENVHKYDFSAEQWKYAYRLHIQANEEIS